MKLVFSWPVFTSQGYEPKYAGDRRCPAMRRLVFGLLVVAGWFFGMATAGAFEDEVSDLGSGAVAAGAVGDLES